MLKVIKFLWIPFSTIVRDRLRCNCLGDRNVMVREGGGRCCRPSEGGVSPSSVHILVISAHAICPRRPAK